MKKFFKSKSHPETETGSPALEVMLSTVGLGAVGAGPGYGSRDGSGSAVVDVTGSSTTDLDCYSVLDPNKHSVLDPGKHPVLEEEEDESKSNASTALETEGEGQEIEVIGFKPTDKQYNTFLPCPGAVDSPPRTHRLGFGRLLKRARSPRNGFPGMSMNLEPSPLGPPPAYPADARGERYSSPEGRSLAHYSPDARGTKSYDRTYDKMLQNKVNASRPGKTSMQGRIYNFLERPTGWKCFIYHFTV